MLALSACQSTDKSSYKSTSTQDPPRNLVGYWSGKVGPFQSSFKIKANGDGLFCFSRGKLDRVEKVKYRSGIIYTERNTKVIIKKLTGKIMNVDVDNFGVVSYVFKKDMKLAYTSRYCQGRLRW